MPALIEENRGQAASTFRYYAAGQNVSALFDDAGLTLDLRGEAVRLELVGSAPTRVNAEDSLPTRINYFVGSDSSKWIRDVRTFGILRYKNVYLGVDMVFHGASNKENALEQDFVVGAGADPSRIRLRFQGANRVELDESGELKITARSKTVRWKKPFVYQTYSRSRHTVESKYQMNSDGTVGFSLGKYDGSKPVVIDPVLSFATYTGTAGNDAPGRMATDAQGNVYIAGSTNDPTFPVTPGGFTANSPGSFNFNATVTKLNATGTQALYTTHFGGTVSNFGTAVALDAAGNIYVCGGTNSPDFPTSANAVRPRGREGDEMAGFVVKLNAAGNQMLYGTYLDGSLLDMATAIAVDPQGNAYVAGVTNSNNFPATPDSFQPSFRASGSAPGYDGFISKLNPQGTSLLYSTFLGGSGTDIITALALDASDGSVYVTGSTSSTNFPVSPRAFRSTYSGGSGRSDRYYPNGDAFVAKLSPDGSALKFSTYLGGKQDDAGMSVAFDAAGNAYVGGSTLSSDFPTTSGAWKTAYAGGGGENDNPSGDGFLAKVAPDGTSLVYSTFAGGSMDDRVWAIGVESSGALWAAGHTISKDFPVTADAAQKIHGGQRAGEKVILGDAFVLRLNPEGSGVTYATFHGGAGNETAYALTIAKDGSVIAGGITSSANLPVTPGAFQARGRGGDSEGSPVLDSFVIRFADAPVAPSISVSSVVNEASGNGGAVAPGLRVVITGQGLAIPDQPTTVLFDSTPAVIESASDTQIIATVPYSTAAAVGGSGKLVVSVGSVRSEPVELPVAASFPGVYPASLMNEDGTANDMDHPAIPGTLLTFRMTGEGQTDPEGQDGLIATADRLPIPLVGLVVAVGDGGVEVISAHAVEGEGPGRMNVIVRLPSDLAAGDYALVVLQGDSQSQQGVRVHVAPNAGPEQGGVSLQKSRHKK